MGAKLVDFEIGLANIDPIQCVVRIIIDQYLNSAPHQSTHNNTDGRRHRPLPWLLLLLGYPYDPAGHFTSSGTSTHASCSTTSHASTPTPTPLAPPPPPPPRLYDDDPRVHSRRGRRTNADDATAATDTAGSGGLRATTSSSSSSTAMAGCFYWQHASGRARRMHGRLGEVMLPFKRLVIDH